MISLYSALSCEYLTFAYFCILCLVLTIAWYFVHKGKKIMPTMMQTVKIVRNGREWKSWAPFNVFGKEWTLVNWVTNMYGNWCGLVYYIFNTPPKNVYWLWVECRQLKFVKDYEGQLPAPDLRLPVHSLQTYLEYQQKNIKMFNGDWIAYYLKCKKKSESGAASTSTPNNENKNKNKNENKNVNKNNVNSTAV